MIFAWDDGNIEHIGEHNVSVPEAEYVVKRAKVPFPRAVGDGKFMVWGATAEGRYLQVIFASPNPEDVVLDSLRPEDRDALSGHPEVAYVVHAMDMTDDQKRRLRRMRGRR